MPHFRVDDQLHNHPKARKAGLEAMGLWNVAGSWCMNYLTDGFVPDWFVKAWPKGTVLAKRLVAAGFWHPAEKDDEKGWQFHEFTGPGRNDSRAEIEATRKKWRDKKAGQRGEPPPDSPQVSPGDTTVESPPDSWFQPQHQQENSGYVTDNATEPNAHGISATPGADLVREIIPPGHPPATLTSLRLQASELLNSGTNRADVAAGLRLWCEKPGVGIGRTILASLVSEAIKARAAPNGHTSGKPPHKLRALAGLAAEVRAAEKAQLENPNRQKAIE